MMAKTATAMGLENERAAEDDVALLMVMVMLQKRMCKLQVKQSG
jgi:hypothetical protein